MRKFVFTIILLLVFIYPVETVQASCTAREMNDPKNVCFYRTDYKTMSKSLTLPNQIQLFSGDIVSAEFDESPDPSTGVNRYYPGHLGSFWAPPYYSSHENYSWSGSNPADQQRSFYTSLVYYNRDYHGGAWEKPVDLETEAFWYPSKTEFTSFFPGGGGGTQIRSVKMALPQRSLALKITETSKTPNTNNPNLLFIIGVDTISKLDHWDRFTESGWNWGAKKSYLSENSETVRAKYLSSDKIVIFYNPANSSYVAVGLDNSASSKNLHWELADNLNPNPQIGFHNRFKNTGILGDVNNEPEKGGAVA